jgi:hypothetical protein
MQMARVVIVYEKTLTKPMAVFQQIVMDPFNDNQNSLIFVRFHQFIQPAG